MVVGKRGQFVLLAWVVPAAVAIACLAWLTARGQGSGWDDAILRELRHVGPSSLAPLMGLFTLAGGGVGILLLDAALVGALWVQRRTRDAAFAVVALAGADFIGLAVKDVVDRPRPIGGATSVPSMDSLMVLLGVGAACALAWWTQWRRLFLFASGAFAVAVVVDRVVEGTVQVEPGYGSFPSGHAVNSAALVLVLLLSTMRGRWRRRLLFAGCLLVVGTGLSRLYFGLHYPSDIFAGWSLALVWVAISWITFERIIPRRGAKHHDV